MVWAANNVNNLILTINPNQSGTTDVTDQFDSLINQANIPLFAEFRLTTSTLFRSGAFNGKTFNQHCFQLQLAPFLIYDFKTSLQLLFPINTQLETPQC